MRDSETRRWTHPATILVATDLSDLDHLMPFAMEQAGETGARLILLHVLSSTAAITADAAGMPYYDTAGALEIAEQMLRPWCEHGGPARHPLRRAGARGPGYLSDCSRRPSVSGGPRAASGHGAGARLASCSLAPWQNKCCARSTSRSLPWDPRLISRWTGARNTHRTCRPACHHTSRDLSPERGACLPDRGGPKGKAGSAACASAHPGDGA